VIDHIAIMARKKVREYSGKRLLKAAMQRLFGIDLPINVAQARADTNFVQLLESNLWLNQKKLVVKPDMLFGQRGKNDLVGLNLTYAEAEDFIRKRMNKEVTIKGCTGPVTTFVVEPFVPHEEEYYLCIQTTRLGTDISFSPAGGVEIEENWDKVKQVRNCNPWTSMAFPMAFHGFPNHPCPSDDCPRSGATHTNVVCWLNMP